jgi:hypothetical protein
MAHDANKETTIADTTVSFIVFFIFWVCLFFIDMIFAFLTALSRYYEFQNDKSMSRQVGFLIQNSILAIKKLHLAVFLLSAGRIFCDDSSLVKRGVLGGNDFFVATGAGAEQEKRDEYY